MVMPLFAFANAGVKIDLSLQHAEIGFGIVAGLLFGKPLGIMMLRSIAVKTGIAEASSGCELEIVARSTGFLAGIGFHHCHYSLPCWRSTIRLRLTQLNEGIIAGSLLAGVAGAVMLRTGRALRDAK